MTITNAAWWKAAGIRAAKTFAQCAVATITASAATGVEGVNWVAVGSASLLAAILSLLTSLAGLPEVEMVEQQREDAPAHDDELEPDEQDGVGDTDEGVM